MQISVKFLKYMQKEMQIIASFHPLPSCISQDLAGWVYNFAGEDAEKKDAENVINVIKQSISFIRFGLNWKCKHKMMNEKTPDASLQGRLHHTFPKERSKKVLFSTRSFEV